MKLPTLLLASLALASLVHAAADFGGIEHKLESALYRGDGALLVGAQQALASEAKANDPAAVYYRGFATYVAASLQLAAGDPKAARTTLEAADATLKEVKGAPWEAEALALRGLITGQLIGVRGRAAGMTLGPKMMSLTSEAYEKLPQSGRVLMCHALTLANTPEMFGGNADEALRLYERAIAALKNHAATGPGWGAPLAYTLLAQARDRRGEKDAARQAIDAALQLEPGYKALKTRDSAPAAERK
jgi:tetratricopeptide (TPR) repeat protein